VVVLKSYILKQSQMIGYPYRTYNFPPGVVQKSDGGKTAGFETSPPKEVFLKPPGFWESPNGQIFLRKI
jgi:hypothetical protein